jgi:hypothetical protein
LIDIYNFGEWLQLFGDEKLTAALLDRLTHRTHILLMNGIHTAFGKAWSSGRPKKARVKHDDAEQSHGFVNLTGNGLRASALHL